MPVDGHRNFFLFRGRLEQRTFIELVRFAAADQPRETRDAPTAIDPPVESPRLRAAIDSSLRRFASVAAVSRRQSRDFDVEALGDFRAQVAVRSEQISRRRLVFLRLAARQTIAQRCFARVSAT